MTLEEAADRVAIRELIDAYAHPADRRRRPPDATTHFIGQSTGTISGAAATGDTYSLVRHASVEGEERTIK